MTPTLLSAFPEMTNCLVKTVMCNDQINLGHDYDTDIAVFQVLELKNAEGQHIGPGKDSVKNFTTENDVLRFIIFDEDAMNNPEEDLKELITGINVNKKFTTIGFDDGSSIKLVGNFKNEEWVSVNDFVDDGIADGYINIFYVTDVIPLS